MEKLNLKVSKTEGMEKTERGQFFTIGNPFKHKEFLKWKDQIKNYKVIEPFAGSNNIVKLNADLDFDSYDIEPQDENIHQRDTIKDFPTGYEVCITNPPYISKSSAAAKKMDVSDWKEDDLYKIALTQCLAKCDYVAAIIPESFINSNYDKSRLISVISITDKMFEDTDCPVCLALFEKKKSDGYTIYRNDVLVGSRLELEKHLVNPEKKDIRRDIKFNDPNGILGVICLDGSDDKRCRFIEGKEIASESIKHYSRAYTRISMTGLTEDNLHDIISKSNDILNSHRDKTSDVFLTPFRGVRKDGMYRRRLDFDMIRKILSLAIKENNIGLNFLYEY